jgi:hypothetical protein
VRGKQNFVRNEKKERLSSKLSSNNLRLRRRRLDVKRRSITRQGCKRQEEER